MLTPEQIADGWIEHDGGPCPVPWGSQILVAFRDGYATEIPMKAEIWVREINQWRHMNRPFDIIAYKPENNHA